MSDQRLPLSTPQAQTGLTRAVTPWVLAVDMGTTSTVISTRPQGGAAEVVEVDGQRTIPSVVFVDEDGSLRVGTTALQLGAGRPDRVVRAPKRRLDDDRPIVVAGLPLAAVELVSALIDHGAREAIRRFGSAPSEVRLTHPAEWPERTQRKLADAAARAGLANLRLIPEPIAAAHGAAAKRTDGSRVAIYDLGGETFDTVALAFTEHDVEVVTKAFGSRAVGGELLDEMLMEAVLDRLTQPIADAIRSSDEPGWIRASSELRAACRAAKEAVSSHSYAEVALTTPAGQVRERLERSEIEHLAEPLVAETMHLLERVVNEAGDVQVIHLVGGGSRMPLVASMIQARFPGLVIDQTGDPRVAVAAGAATLPIASVARAAPPVPAGMADTTHVEPELEPFGNRRRVEPAAIHVPETASNAPNRGRAAIGAVLGVLVVGFGVVLGMQMLGNGTNGGDDAVANASVATTVAQAESVPSTAETVPSDVAQDEDEPQEDALQEDAAEAEAADTPAVEDEGREARTRVVGSTLVGDDYVVTTTGVGQCALGELAVRPAGGSELGPFLTVVAVDVEIVEGPQGSMVLIERCEGSLVSVRSATQLSGQLDPSTLELVMLTPSPNKLENVAFDFVGQRLVADATFAESDDFQEVEINPVEGTVTVLGPSPARPRLDVNPGGLAITDSLTGDLEPIAFGTLRPFVDQQLSVLRPDPVPVEVPASCAGIFDEVADYGGIKLGYADNELLGWYLTPGEGISVETNGGIGLGSHLLDLRLSGQVIEPNEEDGRLIVRFADTEADQDFGVYVAEVSGSANNDVVLHMHGGTSCDELTYG